MTQEARLKKTPNADFERLIVVPLEHPAESCLGRIAGSACVENRTVPKATNKLTDRETFYISRPIRVPIVCHTVQCFVQGSPPQTPMLCACISQSQRCETTAAFFTRARRPAGKSGARHAAIIKSLERRYGPVLRPSSRATGKLYPMPLRH